MSGLQSSTEDSINGLAVREQGNTLRVATNFPHLVSLGTGRLSTAVTLHPIKQGRVTIGSDPTCDIYIYGPGVAAMHCRVESSGGVLTLYPLGGVTMIDQTPATKPLRLEQGCMLTLGRGNYLRFNNPEEAKLMKTVLPVTPSHADYMNNHENLKMSYYPQDKLAYSDSLRKLNDDLDITIKEMCRTKKPPAVPKKPFKEENYESDQETKPKQSSIMAKVNKFEYYAKQQKNVGRSQFYTTHDDEISPKVFSANSLTVNTPAKDVLGGRSLPNYIKQPTVIQDNTRKDYVNVAVKNNTKINHIVRNFDDKLPKKVNNDQQNYGKYNNINVINGLDENMVDNDILYDSVTSGRYDNMYERSWEAESMRNKAYQDRVKEQAQKEAETARLEEILNMCAEYEKQITSGLPITPTEKRAHNKIITNGSLPRSAAMNNPNFVQTSDGYFKFETSHSRNNTMSQSMPARNLSSYENFDPTNCFSDQKELMNNHNYENIGRMDEIGIPVFDDPKSELSSPILIRKLNQSDSKPTTSSPIGSPYENVNKNLLGFKPKSPNTQSPRTRIKTTFAHRNPTSPQYFVFPTPPPTDNKPNYENYYPDTKFGGIEKQLSLEEEIPMIDDSDVTNDIELRHSKIINDNLDDNKEIIQHNDTENNITSIIINKSFDDVKKELMADIPELEEFERDLKESKRNKTTNNNLNIKIIMEHTRKVDVEDKSIDSTNLDENVDELKSKYDNMKEERRKLLSGIHEVKCKMSQIRLHEDDVLRELEMEKALIKGEYDSEIAILNLEQKKRTELAEKVRNVEEEIKALKNRQEARQNEMRERVDIATLKVERLEKDVKDKTATMEELQNAQDILENESKIYEDLEFQHLEEESELLSHREDIQNEMALLTKKIDAQKQRILTLKSEATSNLTSALDETKVLQAEYVRLLNHVEISTTRVQNIEKEIKALTSKLNEIERTQSPDSAFYTDQTRTKSGEFGYSPQSSDSDDLDLAKMGNYIDYSKELKDKLIDQMSQSMIVDIERRFNGNIGDIDLNESPTKLSIGKEKKGFWERNFDSLKRKNKNKKSPEKTDIMTQSLNENMFYNHEIIENENQFDDRFNSLRNSKKEKKDGPIKSSSSSKIPTFSALGKIIKRDSLTRRNRENIIKDEIEPESPKQSYVKQTKPSNSLKYNKAKSLSPEKIKNETENETTPPKTKTKQHRKSCGDEPNTNNETIAENNKIPSQDDIDRISKVTMDAPILSSEDLNTLGKKTFDSLMEIERKRMVMLEEQGCQVIENAREKISELKRRAHDETKKLWDQKYKTDQSSLDNNDSNTQETQPRSGLDTRTSEYQSRNGEQQSRNGEQQSRNGEHQSRNGEHQSRNGEQQSRNGEQQSRNGEHQSRNGEHQSRNGEQQSRNGEQQSRNGEQQSKTGLQHYWNQQLRIRDQQCRQEEQQNKFWDQKSRIAEQLIRTGDQRGNDNNTQMDQNESLSWTVFDDPSSGVISSSSIEELQVRNSLTEDEKRSNESRPLSHASDFSRDTLLVSGRWRGASGRQRPLTRYLPVDREDFDLRTHIDSAGHQVELCPHVTVNSSSCRGYLHKLGAKFHTWSKRWFVFDRESKTFVYYWDKSEKKPRGGAYFQVIEEVYLDHGNTSKSPNPQTTFIVKTRQRRYYLMAPSGEAARIWIDVIFTGAQGYTDYLET